MPKKIGRSPSGKLLLLILKKRTESI